tara:strand:+ start:32 stop:475 length:444 start_codon:yes stop_codon:yes gene_type:complete
MEIYKTKQIKRAIDKISEISESKVSQEVCGLLGKKKDYYVIQECINISETPRDQFVLDPIQYVLFKNEYEPIALFHSHIVGDESPSDYDILMSENSCLPFMIYALNTKAFYIHVPKNLDVDIELVKKTQYKIEENKHDKYKNIRNNV